MHLSPRTDCRYAAVAVIATWQFRSIWALVAASLTASVVSVAISYTVFPHRPRFDFSWSVAKPMFAFGLFLLGNALLQTCREQGMVFLLSRAMDLDQLGYYNRATAFSLALFSQGWTLVWRLTYPTFAKLQTDPARLRAAWGKSTRWLGSAALGGAAGYCLLSPPVVELVLGEFWRPIVPLMQIFGLYALMWFSAASAEALFQAVGRPSIGTRINLVTTVAVLGVGYPLVRWLGVAGAAWAHVAGQALTLPLVIFTCSRLLTRRIRQVKNAATTGDGVLVERQNSTWAPGPGKTGGGELP